MFYGLKGDDYPENDEKSPELRSIKNILLRPGL